MSTKTKKPHATLTTKLKTPPAKRKSAKKLVPRTSERSNAPTNKKSSNAAQIAAVENQSASQPKQKTIRDSFNMPANDYALIGVLKERALQSAQHVKKSELFRAGLKALAAMKPADFIAALGAVDSIKTGRPPTKS
jgi:SLT domain-containing protein